MSTKWKWTLGILGSVVVGALGSGLWSVVFAPLGSAVMRGALSLVTLGISAARDSVYVTASRGFWERPSMIVLAFFAAVVFVSPLYWWMRFRILSRPSTGLRISRPYVMRLMLVLLTFTSAVVFVQLLLAFYTNKVISNFHRTLTIVSPYISPEDQRVYLARFAKMRSRQDFVELFDDLNAVAAAHGEKRSSFAPW